MVFSKDVCVVEGQRALLSPSSPVAFLFFVAPSLDSSLISLSFLYLRAVTDLSTRPSLPYLFPSLLPSLPPSLLASCLFASHFRRHCCALSGSSSRREASVM